MKINDMDQRFLSSLWFGFWGLQTSIFFLIGSNLSINFQHWPQLGIPVVVMFILSIPYVSYAIKKVLNIQSSLSYITLILCIIILLFFVNFYFLSL